MPGHSLQLVVGLGNPGPEYSDTRHNAGAWFVKELARRHGCVLNADKKARGHVGTATIAGQTVRLLVPDTYMNHSGQSVGALANFYKIPADSILVAHDELDIPVGTAKLKQGGGHGGHNGLRDIIQHLANDRGFMRLRLGIGHPRDISPAQAKDVTNYVLKKPAVKERQAIDDCIYEALAAIELVAAGDWQRAQTYIHSYKPGN